MQDGTAISAALGVIVAGVFLLRGIVEVVDACHRALRRWSRR